MFREISGFLEQKYTPELSMFGTCEKGLGPSQPVHNVLSLDNPPDVSISQGKN